MHRPRSLAALVSLAFPVFGGAPQDLAAAQPGPGRPLQLVVRGAEARSFSGIYPHLASFNRRNECGTGAVVPFADRLWWVTYAPHEPDGSDDKLYATNATRDLFVWPDSIGGTPANRLIHAESRQLFLGPYVIDRRGAVRVIPYTRMRGRLTGTARHLTEPGKRVYFATMEEGLYEVDVATLAVRTLFSDTQDNRRGDEAGLPGYHGKGLFSGQGVLVYANNGEYGARAQRRPDTPSGVLAEWDGKGRGRGRWQVVRRNQFTEVTGPGGIRGNGKAATDPLWSVGWDHRSLILMVRSARAKPGASPWHGFRLPKASHCYDGAHGWNTEWPRIRDIGGDDLLMTMHGTFWRFPRAFDVGATAGIAPRSTYLKVVGDFCRFGDEVVLGCDDAAKSEFLNERRAKGELVGPAVSQSNLWFVPPARLDRLGPPLGRGGVFVADAVAAGQWSDPFLFAGYDRRTVHLAHDAGVAVSFRFEVDAGDGRWRKLRAVEVPPTGYRFVAVAPGEQGAWVRVSANRACAATVWFELRDEDPRSSEVVDAFAGLGDPAGPSVGGLLRAGERRRGLQVLASGQEDSGYYELAPDLELKRVTAPAVARWMRQHVAIPSGVVRKEGDSILYVDDDSRRWRLPIGNPAFRADPKLLDRQRACREVATERDLFQCADTFFELPARNAGGFRKIRPIATHVHFVQDYCSWRGLLVLTGLRLAGSRRTGGVDDAHIIRSADGECAVWLGAIDDLWQLGKPRGTGGPWTATAVRRAVPSDPFLMAGYDRKSLALSHDAAVDVRFGIQVDITGDGAWHTFRTVSVPPGGPARVDFPAGFEAYWVRLTVDRSCSATATFTYE